MCWVPCAGEDCGLYVKLDGPSFCKSCQIKRDATTRRMFVQSLKVRRTFTLLDVRIECVGFDATVHCDGEKFWSAAGLNGLALLLEQAASYVAELTHEWRCEMCDRPCNFACPMCSTEHPRPRCPGCYRLGHERGAFTEASP